MKHRRRTLASQIALPLLLAALPVFAAAQSSATQPPAAPPSAPPASAPPASAPPASAPRPIQIESGRLLGVLTADQKVIAYKGIPYAQPPTGDLRWRAPEPVPRSRQLLSATDFGHRCIQFGSASDMTFHDPGASEDCLTLNVWTPSDAPPTPNSPGLPVMVWIHGGGFYMGGSSESRQDGQFLAHRGVIVVSMNYRLGIFGFFAHPELSAESPSNTSGNYGLLDQAAALAWVRRNIRAFGGDPANVTLFGQSAGSQSVSAQMASPLTIGLFAKAIGESGSEFSRAGHDLDPGEQAEETDAAWAERAFGPSKLSSLRSLTTDEIIKALGVTRPTPHFGPIVDGSFLPDTLAHLYAAGKQAHIPLLAGWMANEGRVNPPPTAARFATQAETWFGAKAPEFLAVYPASTDAQAASSAADYATDQGMGFATWSWLEAHVQTGGAPVYRYFFALANPGDHNHTPDLGAFHSDDIEYVFGALDSRPQMAIRPADRLLSDQIQQYWTNFAKTGDPNGATPNPDLPHWPVYNATGGFPVMRFDAPAAASPDTHRPRFLFLQNEWAATIAR